MVSPAPPGPVPGRPRLIVTRPEPEASAWADELKRAGWMAEVLSLIEIGRPHDTAARDALREVRSTWHRMDALMFVSAAAVQHFFGAEPPLVPPPAGNRTRFWAPGPGTARAVAKALGAWGLDAARIDAPAADAAQFDSEHLWPVVAPQAKPGTRLLVVRGHSTDGDDPAARVRGNGREWLMEQCRARGMAVSTCVAYERRPASWSDAQRARAQKAKGRDSLWLFSSSEAVALLTHALPDADWSQARALCTHDRIAEAARQAGFGEVFSSRPALADVLCAIESVISAP